MDQLIYSSTRALGGIALERLFFAWMVVAWGLGIFLGTCGSDSCGGGVEHVYSMCQVGISMEELSKYVREAETKFLPSAIDGTCTRSIWRQVTCMYIFSLGVSSISIFTSIAFLALSVPVIKFAMEVYVIINTESSGSPLLTTGTDLHLVGCKVIRTPTEEDG